MIKYQICKQYYNCDSDTIFEGTYEECLEEFNFYKRMNQDNILNYIDTPFYCDCFENARQYVFITLEKIEIDDNENEVIDVVELDSFYCFEERF